MFENQTCFKFRKKLVEISVQIFFRLKTHTKIEIRARNQLLLEYRLINLTKIQSEFQTKKCTPTSQQKQNRENAIQIYFPFKNPY